MADKVKVLAVCGPTASGKTSVSVALAKQLDGEIICADSMQIYKYLNVGTAKVTQEEMQGIPHHLVDFLEPDVRFSVADYVALAQEHIREIAARGKLPILVGGTGLYVQSVLRGVRFSPQKTDLTLRDALQERLQIEGIEPLYQELCRVDPSYAESLHKNNHGRVLRALELYQQTGKTMSQQLADSLPEQRPYEDVLVGLRYNSRDILYEHINMRVDVMMQADLLSEARFVYENREKYLTAAQAIGYKEFFPYFEEKASLTDCVSKLKQASRNYAKRQITWFSHMENLQWAPAGDLTAAQCIKKMLE